MDFVLGWFFRLFNWGFSRSTGALRPGGGHAAARRALIVLLVYGGLLYLTYWGFDQHADRASFPQQDKGYLLVNVQLPDGASVERTREVMQRIEQIARETPGVAHTVGISGQSLLLGANASNFGSMYVMLDEFDERRGRDLTGDAIAAQLRQQLPARKCARRWCRSSAPRRSTAWATPAASS